MAVIILVVLLGLIIYSSHNQGIPVFLFHHIQPDFEDYLKILQGNRVKTITFSDVLNFISVKKKITAGVVLITIDDGYSDSYNVGFGLLRKYNVKATIFLNTAYIGNDDRYLTWFQVQEMYNSGLVDFELHSHGHCPVFTDNKVIRMAKSEDVSDPKLQYLYSGALQAGDPVFPIGSAYSNRATILTKAFFDTRDPSYMVKETSEQRY